MNFSRNEISTYNKSTKNSPLNRVIAYQRHFFSQNLPEKNPFPIQNSSPKKKLISLKTVFQPHKKILSPDKLWPKITKPKYPFSHKITETNESKKNKIRLQKPSKTLHDFYTVKWLRNKYSDSVVEKSVLSLLPEKSTEIQMIYKEDRERSKRYQKMIEYLNSLKGPVGREKLVEINPKYFFNESTFDKILKLREIFLEFDQRKTQKMNFYEILNMFNQNHIKADKKDIADLFFKGKKIKRKEDIAKLNLGFFQFLRFALRKEQNFKEFMRKIKLKSNSDKDKENSYLPMDFNLIMDYFINKEKERHSINKLKKAVDTLNNDIKINKQDDNLNFNESEILKNERSKRKKQNKKEKGILSDINILDLFNEFISLFNFISNSEINSGSNNNYFKNNKSPPKSQNKNRYNKQISLLYKSFNKNDNNKTKIQLSKTMNKLNQNDDALRILIMNQMNKNTIKNMKLQNYIKYHDIDLSREATLGKIKEDIGYNDNLILENRKKENPKKKINHQNRKIFNTFSS